MVVWALVGVSLVVLSGWAGQVSLGQFALVGIGAAASGSLMVEAGWDAIYSLAGGAAAATTAAIVLGIPALRLRGFFLAVTTLAFAVATDSYLLQLDWLTPDGRVDRPMLFGRIDLEDELAFYLFSVAVLALVVAALHGLRRSQLGRAIVATRDNERGAQAFGVSTVAAKLAAFAVSGAVAGLAGGLLVLHQHRLNADQYEPLQSLEVFTMAAIGGLGSIPGVVVGAVYVRGIQDFVGGPGAILATSLGLVAVLLVMPRGLGSGLYTARDAALGWIARRRGLDEPGPRPGTNAEPDAGAGVPSASEGAGPGDEPRGAAGAGIGAGHRGGLGSGPEGRTGTPTSPAGAMFQGRQA
jgi:branched-chain amino acid transport system permease protein